MEIEQNETDQAESVEPELVEQVFERTAQGFAKPFRIEIEMTGVGMAILGYVTVTVIRILRSKKG